MIKLVELLGGFFGKTKQHIKAKKIGDDDTSTVYDVEFEGTDIRLNSQKSYGEIQKRQPNIFHIYIKNQDRRGKKIFGAKELAEKVNNSLESQSIPFSLDDTHDAWLFSMEKKYVNTLG